MFQTSAMAMETAGTAGLVHVSDAEPGITRRRAGKGFSYRGPDGRPLSPRELARVRGLGIPPAYTSVWICPRADGHLQATGIDARGRKQYRYHPLWQSARSETKFGQLAAFGRALPALRRRLSRALQGDAGDMGFSLAALVLLLDRGYLRVGDAGYTAQNRTFGATTLLARHLSLSGDAVQLRFRAKGGKAVRLVLRDRRLHRILNQVGDLPGRRLFTWLDDEGRPRNLCSQDVNAWLAEVAGPGITAKTFRTWGGTLAAFETALAADKAPLSLAAMAEAAAGRLHNTPAICRKSYIHPAVLDLARLPAEERAALLSPLVPAEADGLRKPERLLLSFLEQAESG